MNNLENIGIEQKEKEINNNKIIIDKRVLIVYIVSLIIIIAISAYTTISLYRVVNLSKQSYSEEVLDKYTNMVKTMIEIDSLYNNFSIIEDPGVTQENIENALRAFTATYNDKYGMYIDPESFKIMLNNNEGKSTSTGLMVIWEPDNEKYYIDGVVEESPAYEQGIKIGEYLVAVNGITLNNNNRTEVLGSLSHDEGTEVTYSIEDNNGNIRDVKLIMTIVNNKSVDYRIIDNDIGYVKISEFVGTTNNEFRNALNDLRNQGINNIIFDLRNNRGGLADAVVPMVDYICPKGLIMKQVGKDGRIISRFTSDEREYDANIVIITNGSSASASELFTQSLRDFNKAIVVGENTFGKGTVLSEYTLSNGGGLELSSAKYYTKSGYEIEEVGIAPDIEVKLSDDKEAIYYKLEDSEDDQLQEAIKQLRNN